MIYILNFTRGRGTWLNSTAKKPRVLSCLEMVFNYLLRCIVLYAFVAQDTVCI